VTETSDHSEAHLNFSQKGFLVRLGSFVGILFWLWLAALVLLGIEIFWLGAHPGPVR